MHLFHWPGCVVALIYLPALNMLILLAGWGKGTTGNSLPVITLVTFFSPIFPNHRAITGHLAHLSIGIRNENRVQFGSANTYDVSVLCQELW